MISLLLLSIFPILFLFNQNRNELYLNQTFLPIIIALIGTFLIYWIYKLFYKSKPKAMLATYFAVILFYSFGHVNYYLKSKFLENNELFQQGWILLLLLTIIY